MTGARTAEKAGIVFFGVLALYFFARALKAQPRDTRTDTSSFGPVEHVGPIGNTGEDDAPLAPRPGENAALPFLLPSASLYGAEGCSNRPLFDFHSDCLGNTWTAFPESNIAYVPGAADWIAKGYTRKLSSAQVRAALLDPSLVWIGLDYRAVPVQ